MSLGMISIGAVDADFWHKLIQLERLYKIIEGYITLQRRIKSCSKLKTLFFRIAKEHFIKCPCNVLIRGITYVITLKTLVNNKLPSQSGSNFQKRVTGSVEHCEILNLI